MFIRHAPKRIKIKGYVKHDCTIVALGNALGISYDLARKILQTGIYKNKEFSFMLNNPRTKQQFCKRRHIKQMCSALSISKKVYVYDYELMARKKSKLYKPEIKKTLQSFAKDYNEGIYIVLLESHLTVVINGVIIDTWNPGNEEVHIAYKINVEHALSTISELASYYRMNTNQHIVNNHIDRILLKSKSIA